MPIIRGRRSLVNGGARALPILLGFSSAAWFVLLRTVLRTLSWKSLSGRGGFRPSQKPRSKSMNRETTEKCLANRAAHAMRAAAVRLAGERAEQDADPFLAYGCVDWFRYDAAPRPRVAKTGTQREMVPPAH